MFFTYLLFAAASGYTGYPYLRLAINDAYFPSHPTGMAVSPYPATSYQEGSNVMINEK